MKFGWLDTEVVLHEFGHAIGLAHEHQSPRQGIEWNEQAVIEALSGPPNYWSEFEIRTNVLEKYREDQINGTEFDPDSIMLYFFPPEWTKNGQGTKGNTALSDKDMEFVGSALAYPFPSDESIPRLSVVQDAVVNAELPAGDHHLYCFSVGDPSAVTIETLGDTDLVLSLFGPDSKSAFIASDDDSGEERNARIVRHLPPGKYFVETRHYSRRGDGSYGIRVSRSA